MGTAILIILGIIIGFAVLAFIFSKDGEREDAAKTGAIVGGTFIVAFANSYSYCFGGGNSQILYIDLNKHI